MRLAAAMALGYLSEAATGLDAKGLIKAVMAKAGKFKVSRPKNGYYSCDITNKGDQAFAELDLLLGKHTQRDTGDRIVREWPGGAYASGPSVLLVPEKFGSEA